MLSIESINSIMSRYRRPKESSVSETPQHPLSNRHTNYKRTLFIGGIGITLIAVVVLFNHLQSTEVKGPVEIERNYETWHLAKNSWQPRVLNREELTQIAQKVDQVDIKPIFNSFMIPRPPGTLNITIVGMYIRHKMEQELGWTVEEMTFTDQPPHPYPPTQFKNIIATHNPGAARRLVLACHYDSKITPTGFLGACDSAMPCSMMIEIAFALREYLDQRKLQQQQGIDRSDLTLEFLFFDGEEAFDTWTETDSLYGSRHMASRWTSPWNGRSRLDSIDLFVLLDLIGTTDTQFYNLPVTSSRWFNHLAELELQMYRAGLLTVNNTRHTHRIFIPRTANYNVEDDHVPFHRAGVPIMHLISVPFPTVWHEITDNEFAMNYERTEVISRVMTAFVAKYLQLNM
uniref:glutaminyl-peptide cyclotransferase n=2 Tax=Ciona intestinalis TaxID=7719 RepID=F6XS17_CIOIN|nr:glutaminyl-peptide cyclotransferase isoform X1 [Ciona intestinalis]|eukprot:XP_018670675.1 glutaminyl-peptide cyclotransferase isoform X1 [Ciona intestinalis]